MNFMALIALLALGFFLVSINQWVWGGLVFVMALVYMLSSTVETQKRRSEYTTAQPAPYSGPGAEEKVGTSVGKGVNVVGSLVGGLLKLLFAGHKHETGGAGEVKPPVKAKTKSETEYY